MEKQCIIVKVKTIKKARKLLEFAGNLGWKWFAGEEWDEYTHWERIGFEDGYYWFSFCPNYTISVTIPDNGPLLPKDAREWLLARSKDPIGLYVKINSMEEMDTFLRVAKKHGYSPSLFIFDYNIPNLYHVYACGNIVANGDILMSPVCSQVPVVDLYTCIQYIKRHPILNNLR